MAIELTDIRVSFVWAETVLDPSKDAPQGGGLNFLSQRYAFGPFFEKAREKPVTVDQKLGLSLSAPWPKPTGQRFWQSYLERQSLGSLSGLQAWKALVPLRAKVPFPITTSLTGATPSFDAFFYPHGLALLATVRLAQKFSLNAAVAEAIKLRRDPVFTVQWQPGQTETAPLDAIADRTLNKLREYGWGKGSSGRRTALDPFTLFTAVRGSGVDGTASVAADSEIHRALEAVTNWSVSWQTDKLPALDQARISSHHPPPADTKLLYAGKRGRALWFPPVFTGPPEVSTLACYHRNLTLASLQTESLCGIVNVAAKRIAGKETLTLAERECARNASGLLGRLYGGDDSVYRSWSLRAQIDRSGFADDINAVRSFFNMTPLS